MIHQRATPISQKWNTVMWIVLAFQGIAVFVVIVLATR